MKKKSRTDWERINSLQDDQIDVSEIAPLDESFFANAELRMPKRKSSITIRIDPEVLDWFKSQGAGYQSKMNAVLRMYVETQMRQSSK